MIAFSQLNRCDQETFQVFDLQRINGNNYYMGTSKNYIPVREIPFSRKKCSPPLFHNNRHEILKID